MSSITRAVGLLETQATEPLEVMAFQSRRLWRAGIITPGALFIAGAATAMGNMCIGLVPLAVALGWTQLVGL